MGSPLDPIHDDHYITHKLSNDNSLYPINEPVGKSSEQVGRSAHDNSFISNDHGVYERWGTNQGQASQSIYSYRLIRNLLQIKLVQLVKI